MIHVRLIVNTHIPKGSIATHCALMPKVFCVIKGEKAKVFVNRKIVRRFQHFENGLLKQNKIFHEELSKARRFYKEITAGGPIYLSSRRMFNAPVETPPDDVETGFDNVI